MATLSKGYTFGATESVTNTKLHNLIDLGSISGIVDADVDAGAAISSTKLDLSSAGYLTTGGDFDVTGEYSFSNLSWTNIGSLASINNAQIKTSDIKTLLSSNFTASLASILDLRIGTAYIQSLASIGSPIHYTGIVSSLASGAHAKFDGVDRFVGDLISSQVVAFSFGNTGDYVVNSYGLVIDDDDSEPAATSVTHKLWMNGAVSNTGTTNRNVIKGKFKKIAGLNTVTVYASIWLNSGAGGTDAAVCTVDIGGQTGSGAGTIQQSTPEWINFTVDVSSLSDGTVYDLSVGIKCDNGAAQKSYIDQVIGFYA